MAYTAGEFDAALRACDRGDITCRDSDMDAVVEVALRIASAVMRPGFMDDAIRNMWIEEVTRSAPTDDK